jgi:hypothetical protein
MVGWDVSARWPSGHRKASARLCSPGGSLLGTPGDPTAGQVVGRHLNGDLVAG